MMNNKVAVLMCTYNGERYLKEQLNSLLRQTYPFTLFVHDDGSSDRTKEILEEYEKKENVIIFRYTNNTHSASYNFMSLLHKILEYENFEYFFFSDQDDVWIETKIEDSLKLMEKKGKQKPLLVYCDQSIVDENMNLMFESQSRTIAYKPDDDGFKRVVFRNTAPGCCICINRQLARIIDDVDYNKILMHDWWAMLVASCCGEICYIDEPLIKYRQHNNNTLGFDNNNYLKKAKRYILNGRNAIQSRKRQTNMSKLQVFLLNEEYVNEEHKEEIIRFKEICGKGKMKRILYFAKNRYIKANNIFTFIFV